MLVKDQVVFFRSEITSNTCLLTRKFGNDYIEEGREE
jgi:hypothetical protein